VELAKSETRCPLCNTEVVNPAIKEKEKNIRMPFPERENESDKVVTRYGIWLLLTIVFLVPALVTLICDYNINSGIVWSGYVAVSLGVLYVMLVLPVIIPSRKGILYLSVDFVAIFLLLYYICESTGGKWIFSFAAPVLILAYLYIAVMMLVESSGRVPRLLRAAVAFYLAAVLSTCIEGLVIIHFAVQTRFIWSYYPFIVFLLFGTALVVVETNKPLKEKIKRKFFI